MITISDAIIIKTITTVIDDSRCTNYDLELSNTNVAE